MYTFDDLGRTTAENWYATAASTTSVHNLTWAYDSANGRMSGSGSPAASDTFVYDSLGRIQTATQNVTGISTPFTSVPSYSLRDERLGLNIFYGSVISGLTPDPIVYAQSALFDALGQPTQLSLAAYGGGPAQQANFSYDLAGQTTKIQRTQGSVVATESRLAYDNQGRLASLQHVQTGTGFTRQVARYDQAYDAVNRITRIDSSVDEASVYNYDKTGQLLTAQMTFENNEAYTYDANGNRTSGGTISNGSHKNLVTQDAKYTYLYDGENNRTRRTEKTTGYYQLYIWDHRNRLARVEFVNASGVTVRATEYRYDASDMKVAEFVDTTAPFDMANASAKWFIYDGADVVLDFARADMSQAPGATISKRYFQGPGVDQLLAQENIVNNASQSVWWILPDHLGSTRDLVTASGSVVAHFQFDSFGNILDGRENVTRYQFTGREHDSNTDLNYHRARWYDPFSGKWLSEDPIGFAAGDANVTRYVGNGVLNATDPSGLWKKSNKQHIWIAEFGDSFDGLAQRVGRNGVAKFAIRPLRPSSNTSVDYGSMTEDWNERLITPCGEYSTRYLENPPKGKGGHAAVSVGKDFDPDFRFVVGARKFFGTKNFASGLGHDTERAVRWIAGQASFGAAPLSSLWIIGHCCATCSNIGGLTQNLSAEDFQLNGRHGFDFPIWEDAVNGRLTPGFWFSQTASLRLIGCNSSNLAKSFADELLWTSANAYGTTTFAMAAFDGKSMGWSNDGVTFGGKMYTDHASYFASPNWQSHPGSTKYPF